MSMKRKRSVTAFTLSTHDFSIPNPLFTPTWAEPVRMPLFFQQSKPNEYPGFDVKDNSKVQQEQESESRHLNSRTRKRHRDNRPDEQDVHAATMSKLFDAQRRHPDAEPVMSRPLSHGGVEMAQQQQQQRAPQKSTLHAFWNLPGAAAPQQQQQHVADRVHVEPSHAADLTCEDCDRPLQSPDSMDVDEDIVQRDCSCHACGKRVCDLCAVVFESRACLECAMHGG